MADIKSPTERYKAIADAIREKNGTTELMHPADMPQAILDIVSGGGANYDYSALYSQLSVEKPSQSSEEEMVDFIGDIVGVSE